ncbi:MAG TPA: rod shape-determining protein MreC [Candidatus Sulfotelmatobacter sp.]|nr:rod shape-determining protein MreC [Candidatus Sulfotelmatobacter sp.]
MPAALIVLALVISFSSFRGLFGVRALLLTAFYPAQIAGNAVWRTVVGVPLGIINLTGLSRENTELRRKLNIAQARDALYDELQGENARLKEALAFQGRDRYGLRLLAAQVLGREGETITIGRGAAAGVKNDQPVIVKAGLVGRVVEVARFSAKVQLLTDPLSAVAAVDQKSRDNGVLTGYTPGAFLLKYVSAGEIGDGDPIVTSPSSTIFPAGIPLGTVSRIGKKESDLFYWIEVKPAVKYSRLEEVFVVL